MQRAPVRFFENSVTVKRCWLLTHLGRVTYICASKLPTIGSDNGLAPGRRQAISWTNAGLLLIGHLWTNFSEILIEIRIFSFKKMHFKESSAKWRSCCLGLHVLSLYCLLLKPSAISYISEYVVALNKKNYQHYADDIFICILLRHWCVLIQIFTTVCYWVSDWQHTETERSSGWLP